MAAHRENVEGRNNDFQAIVAKTEFRDVALMPNSAADYATMKTTPTVGQRRGSRKENLDPSEAPKLAGATQARRN